MKSGLGKRHTPLKKEVWVKQPGPPPSGRPDVNSVGVGKKKTEEKVPQDKKMSTGGGWVAQKGVNGLQQI